MDTDIPTFFPSSALLKDFCRQDRYCKDSKEQTEWQIANV
uniref:Glutamate rich 2 n=1 Tax=Homo sapiens TaxID=9606 RepID=A0A8V8TKZ3_HUMAN